MSTATKPLTAPMLKALAMMRAHPRGWVSAGYNVIDGHGITVSARTIDALVARGFAVHGISPDGGSSCTLCPWV